MTLLALAGLCAAMTAGAAPKTLTPDEVTAKVEVIEKLNAPLPGALTFTDWRGRRVTLESLLHRERPVILSLVYYRCPSLCQLVLSGLVTGLRGTGLRLGEDYDLVTLSIDPSETPAMASERRRGHLQALGVPDAGEAWSYLTGDEAQIRALADAVGFSYAYDASLGQFAHAATLFVVTGDGRLSRYLYGVRFAPRDLKLALVEAGEGRVGTAFDRFLLTCYQFDPASKRYALVVRGVIQGGGLLVFLALGGLLTVLWRRERVRA